MTEKILLEPLTSGINKTLTVNQKKAIIQLLKPKAKQMKIAKLFNVKLQYHLLQNSNTFDQ